MYQLLLYLSVYVGIWLPLLSPEEVAVSRKYAQFFLYASFIVGLILIFLQSWFYGVLGLFLFILSFFSSYARWLLAGFLLIYSVYLSLFALLLNGILFGMIFVKKEKKTKSYKHIFAQGFLDSSLLLLFLLFDLIR